METSRNVMAEQGEGVVVPTQTEVLDNVDDDLDRIELWTAALSSFQHPPPVYQPSTVRGDERMMLARNAALPLREVMRSAFRSQPYIAVTIALGIGWLLGRMHRAL
jgi:hypothetical protein